MRIFVALLSLFVSTMAFAADAPLSSAEIKQVVDSHVGELKTCLKVTPPPTGKLVVHYIILPSGKVEKVTTQESSTDNKAVDTCILGVFRHLEFPKPRGGATMEQLYPFTFLPPKGPTSKLDPKVVVETFAAHKADIAACAGPATKDKSGTLTVEIDIVDTGAVNATRKQSSTTGSDAFDTCVLAAVKKFQFPKPEGKGLLTIAFPIELTATAKK